MPILGIIDSAKTGRISTSSYESIATINVGAGGASNITFSSIPNTYTHLELRYFGFTDRTSNNLDDFFIRVGNGSTDSGSNYSMHTIYGNGSNIDIFSGVSATSIFSNICVGSSPSGNPECKNGIGVIQFLDYKNTNKWKTVRALAGCEFNGTPGAGNPGRVGITTGAWFNTLAINQITMSCANSNWAQYSTFGLYGIKEKV